MIEDSEMAVALGWTQGEGRGQLLLPGGGQQTVKVWLDEAGQRHPLRPFTSSYDVMIEEATKRGLDVAFRSDSDQVVVWRRGRRDQASSSKGLPLCEGLCACVLDQLGLLGRLPAGKAELLRAGHLARNFEGDLESYRLSEPKLQALQVTKAVEDWKAAHPGQPLPALIPVADEPRPWWKRLLRLS
ncbi:MAG: hypothetical protein KGL39_34885 [Patescibacteria group bacterium]|nr:hypothetical protein [Patescibacteria group bacterium]